MLLYNFLHIQLKFIFSPTVSHSLPYHEQPSSPHTYPRVADTQPLRYYQPHIPQDQQSRENLLAWIKYPGVLKIVQLARNLEAEFTNPPSEQSKEKMNSLIAVLIRNSRAISESQAGPLVCSITIATLYSGTTSPNFACSSGGAVCNRRG